MMYSIVLSTLIVAATSNIIPEDVYRPCNASDENVMRCVTDQLFRPSIIQRGIREINLPSMDPFKVDEVLINQYVTEYVKVQAKFSNMTTTGMKDLVLEDVQYDRINHTTDVRLRCPQINWETDYDVKGLILIVPLGTKGHVRGNFTDIKSFIRVVTETFTDAGEEYFRIKNFYFVSRVGNGSVEMVADDPQMQFAADMVANFYNAYPRLFMDAINPIYVQHAAAFLKDFFNNALKNVPAKELFLN